MTADLIAEMAAAWWQSPRSSLARTAITAWVLHHVSAAVWRHALAAVAQEAAHG